MGKEIYNLSEKDRQCIGKPIGLHTVRYLTRAEVTIPLGSERFNRKHFGVIHAL